jgi:heat shock protein HtpX
VTDADLFTQQEQNRRRSFWLVTGFVLFFAWIGFGGDLAWYLATAESPEGSYRHVVPWVGLLISAVAGGMAWVAWRTGPEKVLRATGAWEVITPDTPERERLVNVVEEMAIASGLPRPRIWVVPDEDPNAFATGRDERSAHVAVTEGLLKLLDRDELQGVVAHEMSHIRNYDVRLMTLLAALVGAMALMSDTMRQFFRHGGRVGGRTASRSGGRGGGKGGNPIAVVVLVLWLVSLVLAPLVSRLLAMAVSRKREFLADATAAQFTRNPMGLADALEKIEAAGTPTHKITRGAAHLCIVDPLGRKLTNKTGFLADTFATHPPMAMRLTRLRGMAYQAEKVSGER